MERLAALLGVPLSALLEEEKQDMPQLTPRDQRDIAEKAARGHGPAGRGRGRSPF